MKKEYPSASIITVNYNGKRFLKECFDSLLSLNYPKDRVEIIMIDNCSTDDSVEFVRENFPQIKAIHNDINNYCKANNLGIAQSRSEYVALLNNDTKVDKDWLKELIDVMEVDKSIGAAGSKILLFDGRIQNAGHIALPNFYWAERGFGLGRDSYNELEELTSLCGAAVLYRKKLFEKVGYFDEDFIIYMEDVEMAFRLRKSGWKAMFVPNSIIYHAFHGSGYEELSRLNIERNRLLFIAKHYPDKLSAEIFGRGYFTVSHDLSSCGKIFQILPDVLAKLQKHHNPETVKGVLNELFEELGRISNYENNVLIQEILIFKKQLEEQRRKIEENNTLLSQNQTTLSSTQSELSEARVELHKARCELNKTQSDFVQAQTILSRTQSELNKTQFDFDQARSSLSRTQSELSQAQSELLLRTETLNQKTQELNGIYSSEGFRLILRPLWDSLLILRKITRAFGSSKKQFLNLITFLLLSSLSAIMIFIFFCEYLLWEILKHLLIIKIPPKNIASSQDSKISIVIPNYNGVAYLKKCLPSIFRLKEFQNNINEVIIVDDASCDNSINYLKENYPQVTLICNNKNLGFGKSCNNGVRAAKNESIILLNNDVIISNDAIQPLIEHLREEEVFAISPRLYSWDEQAFLTGVYVGSFKLGYIHIWNEKDVSSVPKLHSAAPTMFAIGCAACFRKRDFLAMGGFDKIYEPYSWEDIDLSYRALKRGMRVIYEPGSFMYHKMHGTIGVFKRSIEIKNELLFTWKNITDPDKIFAHFLLFPLFFLYKREERSVLIQGYLMALSKLFLTLSHRFRERKYSSCTDKEIFHKPLHFYNNSVNKSEYPHKERSKTKTILVITPFLPYPLKSGGQVKMYNTLKELSRESNIILISFIERTDQKQDAAELNKLCKKVFTVLRRPSWNAIFNKISIPVFIKYFYSKEMEDNIQQCLKDYEVDLVQVEYINMAYYAKSISGLPKVLVEHDTSIYTLANSYERPLLGIIFRFFDWLNRKKFQKDIYGYFDKIIAFTKEDSKIMRRAAASDKISIIPIGIDLDSYELREDAEKVIDILFVGHMLHYPNLDGLNYFKEKIFPIIKKKLPEVKFCILGSGIDKERLGIQNDRNIEVIGEVEDVRPYLSKTKIMVVPIRLGGGIKVKALEAMAMGIPVVATASAVKGLNVAGGKDIYIADSPKDFANKVLDLLIDEPRRVLFAKNSRDIIEKYYDSAKLSLKLKALHDSLINSRTTTAKNPDGI